MSRPGGSTLLKNKRAILRVIGLGCIMAGAYLMWDNRPGQFPTAITDKEFEPLKRGVNVSHWFALQASYPDSEMLRFMNPRQMRDLHAMGFRHVRLPVEMDAITLPDRKTIDPKRVKQLQQAVDIMIDAGLYVILDFHPDAEYKVGLVSDKARRAQFIRDWETLGGIFAGYEETKIGFEILSEPDQQNWEGWWQLQGEAIAALRKVIRNHTIFAGGDEWNSIRALVSQRPYRDPRTVYVIHYYDPILFTHQGAPWMNEAIRSFSEVEYPSTAENNRKLEGEVRNMEMATVLKNHKERDWNAQAIDSDLKVAAEWARHHGVKLICTEFGLACRDADVPQRNRWLRDARVGLEKNGIGWSFYNSHGAMGFGWGNDTRTMWGFQYGMVDALGLRPPPRMIGP